jgi:hypothetical protein
MSCNAQVAVMLSQSMPLRLSRLMPSERCDYSAAAFGLLFFHTVLCNERRIVVPGACMML